MPNGNRGTQPLRDGLVMIDDVEMANCLVRLPRPHTLKVMPDDDEDIDEDLDDEVDEELEDDEDLDEAERLSQRD